MRKILVVLILFGSTITLAQSSLITSEDALKLRNLQYEQAKRVVRMQDLRTEFERLNSESEKLKIEIGNWIKEQAKKQNVDLKTHYFDSDQLKFVEIKKNEQKNPS